MRKIFVSPEMTVSAFSAENIITTSLTPTSTVDLLKKTDSGITLDNISFTDESKNIISFAF